MSQCSPRPHGLSYIPSFPTGIKRGPPARRHSLRPHGLEPTRLLCPWDFPGKNIGVGCHFLLQGGLPDPGIKLTFPALQADSLLLIHLRELNSPITHQAGITGHKASCALTQNTQQLKHGTTSPFSSDSYFFILIVVFMYLCIVFIHKLSEM